MYIIDVWKFPLIDGKPDLNRDYEFAELNTNKTTIVTESAVSYADTLLCLDPVLKQWPMSMNPDEYTIIGDMFKGTGVIAGAMFLHHKGSCQEFRTIVIDPHMWSYLICVSD